MGYLDRLVVLQVQGSPKSVPFSALSLGLWGVVGRQKTVSYSRYITVQNLATLGQIV